MEYPTATNAARDQLIPASHYSFLRTFSTIFARNPWMFHADINTALIQSLKSTANNAAEAQLPPAVNTTQLPLPAANTTQLPLPAANIAQLSLSAANTTQLSLPAANTAQFLLPSANIERDQGWIPRFIHAARDEVSTIATPRAIRIFNFSTDEGSIPTATRTQSIIQSTRRASRTQTARDTESIIRAAAAQSKTKGNKKTVKLRIKIGSRMYKKTIIAVREESFPEGDARGIRSGTIQIALHSAMDASTVLSSTSPAKARLNLRASFAAQNYAVMDASIASGEKMHVLEGAEGID